MMIKKASLTSIFTDGFTTSANIFFRTLAFSEKTLNIVSQF